MKKSVIVLNFIVTFLISCNDNDNNNAGKVQLQRKQPKINTYRLENSKQWFVKHSSDSNQLQIAFAVNRTDRENFEKMDSVVIPVDMSGDIVYYLPFPLKVSFLKDISKIIFFSYPTQIFATYENGILIYTGQTNMGRKKDPTPTGLFYTNWKAEETTSTFNDEWNLHWNFNIVNTEGVGWHQYSLPGYPASHSCLRLQEKDAYYLYNWADEWILTDESTIHIKGTPVIVFGNYDFDAPKPWLQLIANPRAIDISESEMQNQTAPYLDSILYEQNKRAHFRINNNK